MTSDARKPGKGAPGLVRAVDQVASVFQKEFRKYGYGLDALMWNKGTQDAHFKVKFDIGTLTGSKILDVGCGFGHMLDYLQAWNINASYTGIDICPEFIDIARQRHPGADFRLLNILEADIGEVWDWVFLVGAFNYATTGSRRWWGYVQKMLRRMYELCSQGVAADFLSTYVDFQKQNAFHVRPERVFAYSKTITRRVALRHDYMPYDFTVYLYRSQDVTANNIFLDYKKNLPPEIKV